MGVQHNLVGAKNCRNCKYARFIHGILNLGICRAVYPKYFDEAKIENRHLLEAISYEKPHSNCRAYFRDKESICVSRKKEFLKAKKLGINLCQ